MKSADAELRAGFGAARKIARRTLRGIELPAAFLPRGKRDGIYSVLALCEMIHSASAGASDEVAEMMSDRLRAIASEKLDLPLPEMRSEDQHALYAAAKTIARYEIPIQYFLDFVEALRSEAPRYATWPSLEKRCQAISGNVAKVVASVLGLTHSDGAARAGTLGVAIELTRILRDLKANSERGKLYLPLADLAQIRYSERDLAAGTVNDRFRELLCFEIGRARDLYRQSTEAIPWLADDGSRVFSALVIATGMDVLDAMQNCWRELLTRPPRVMTARMLCLLPRAWRMARHSRMI